MTLGAEVTPPLASGWGAGPVNGVVIRSSDLRMLVITVAFHASDWPNLWEMVRVKLNKISYQGRIFGQKGEAR